MHKHIQIIDRRILKEVRTCLKERHLTCVNGYFWIEKLIIRFLLERKKNNQFQKRIDDIIVELKQSNPYKKGFLAKFNKDKKTGKLVLSSNHKVWNDCCKELEKILKEGEK